MSHNDITNVPPQDTMLAGLERLARDSSISTDRITELFRLAERREQTLQRRMFNDDMNALQTTITQIMRDKPNPAFNSKYATEEQIDRAARPEYTRHGFSIRFGTEKPEIPGNIRVTCTVAHRDGYYEEHALEAPAIPANRGVTQLQAVGGTVTYLKRTLIRMVLNLVTYDNKEDDDGNGHTDGGANDKRDPLVKYAEWTDRFELAANSLADSDAAKELMGRDTVVRMLTEMPHGATKQRFMQIRAGIEKKWLTPMNQPPTTQPDTTKDGEIEGL